MTPAKLLIAQCLMEAAREIESIAVLADEYKDEPRWALHTAELRRAGELARWWATEIRTEK